jgi:ArsR family transcriptional regulator, zinc-responsive transcriptional repressor
VITESGEPHDVLDSHGEARGEPADAVGAASELLRTLGAPNRLAIVLELTAGPRCVHDLVDELGISQPLASQHLRVLRHTGLVTSSRRGRETVYSLTDAHVGHIALDAVAHGGETLPPETSSGSDAVHREHDDREEIH